MRLWTNPRVPELGCAIPRAHGRLLAAVASLGMGLWGWRFEGNFPDRAKMVVIVAPHTSNWDFLVGLLAKIALRLKGSFIGKHTLFRWPFGTFLRAIGGIPVNRAAPLGVVEDALRAFRDQDRLLLVIAPEGTRRKVEKWKSGFYRIAEAVGVPIALVAFDYRRQVVRIGPSFEPTGDYERDLAEIQSHFDASMGRRPENF